METKTTEYQKILDRRQSAQRHRVIRFTLKDIADIRGIKVSGVHSAIRRGLLDPTDLESVARYVLRVKDVPGKYKKGNADPCPTT